MIALVNEAAALWWSWMGPMLWQASLLVVLVGALDALLRKWAWPQVRYALWLLVLVKLLLPPSLHLPSGIVPHLQPLVREQVVSSLFADARRAGGGRPVLHRTASADAPASGPTAHPPIAAPDRRGGLAGASGPGSLVARDRLSWQTVALSVWLLGMLGLAGALTVRIATLRRWRRAEEARDAIPPWFHELLVRTAQRLKLEPLPAIVFSDRAATPAVYGLLRPTLLLPVGYIDALSVEEAEHVLLHELAHIKRGDLFVNFVCLVVQVIYWFNPFVAWARRRMKQVRELCCDLTIASVLRERTAGYRATLLNTARRLLTEAVAPGMGLLGVFEEPFRLVPRLRWLERRTWERRRLAAATALAAAALLAPLVIPMAAARATIGFDAASDLAGATGVAGPAAVRTDAPSAAEATRPDAGARAHQQGDLYVRDVTRVDRTFLGIAVDSRRLYVTETWIGDGVVATSEQGKTMIVDRRRRQFTLIDHEAQTYTEASLPLRIADLVGDEIASGLHRTRTSGEVSDTGRTRQVLGRRCKEYEVAMWRVADRGAAAPRMLTVWATTDAPPPFDLATFQEHLDVLRQLANRDVDLRRELRKIEGLQLRIQLADRKFWTPTYTVSETEAIERRTAPPGTYEPPPGYKKLDRIARLDF